MTLPYFDAILQVNNITGTIKVRVLPGALGLGPETLRSARVKWLWLSYGPWAMSNSWKDGMEVTSATEQLVQKDNWQGKEGAASGCSVYARAAG